MTTRRFFGTDGIRGPYGGPVINEDFAARLGAAAGKWLGAPGRDILIGWDTRASGEPLARAVARGFGSAGFASGLLGVLPTPAIAWAVRTYGAAMGVVITGSHNPADDNGIKFFGSDGRKLTDAQELEIEGCLVPGRPALGPPLFPVRSVPDALGEYVAAALALLPASALLGWRVVLDTANGATCATSPAALRALGADVLQLGASPNGRNINDAVGSEHPEALCRSVRSSAARLGIAHDGDGDRCLLCDEKGDLLDGDEVMALLATDALERGQLAARTLVATVQSNLGLDAAVQAAGGTVLRTSVGDRYVIERMKAAGANFGGESSGHFIFSTVSPTGDGLVAAIKVIGVMLASGRPLSELRRRMTKFPQASATLPVRRKIPIGELPRLSKAIRALEAEMGSRGRVLVRYSGTEPILRLLVEGPEEAGAKAGIAGLLDAARADLA